MTGDCIKAIRKAMGLTQMEFARAFQVSFATVNRWERGHYQPLPDRLAKLREWRRKARKVRRDGRVRFKAHVSKT